jgi:hypothetical protein
LIRLLTQNTAPPIRTDGSKTDGVEFLARVHSAGGKKDKWTVSSLERVTTIGDRKCGMLRSDERICICTDAAIRAHKERR